MQARCSIWRLNQNTEANLATARANFERVIEFAPGRLSAPGPHHWLLPRSVDAAKVLAERESPNVIAATFRRTAAQFATAETRGKLLPRVNLSTTCEGRMSPNRTTDRTDQLSIIGQVTVPIHQAGTVRSQIRQSTHNNTAARLHAVQAKRIARGDLIAAWSWLIAARSQLASDRVNIEASKALEGLRHELKAGQRTTLKVLNADTALLAGPHPVGIDNTRIDVGILPRDRRHRPADGQTSAIAKRGLRQG